MNDDDDDDDDVHLFRALRLSAYENFLRNSLQCLDSHVTE